MGGQTLTRLPCELMAAFPVTSVNMSLMPGSRPGVWRVPCAGTRILSMSGCPAELQPASFGNLYGLCPGLQPHFLPTSPLQPAGVHPARECCWKGSCSPGRWQQLVSVRRASSRVMEPRWAPSPGTKSAPLGGSSPQLLPHSLVEFYVTAWKHSQRKLGLFFPHLEGDRNPFSVSIPGAAGCHLGAPNWDCACGERPWALLLRAEPRKQVDVPGKFN